MGTSKQQSLATISAATRALAEATTPEQTQAVAAMSEAAMAWAKASGDYGLLIEAKRVHVRARFRTVELVRALMPSRGGAGGSTPKRKDNDILSLSAREVLDQVGLTEVDWHNLLGEWRTLKGADGHLREDLLDAYLGKQAEEGEDPTTAGLLRYIDSLFNPPKPKPAPKRGGDTPLDEATFLIKDLTEVLHQIGTITDASQVKGRLATARKIRQLFTAVVKGLDKLIAQLEAYKEGDK